MAQLLCSVADGDDAGSGSGSSTVGASSPPSPAAAAATAIAAAAVAQGATAASPAPPKLAIVTLNEEWEISLRGREAPGAGGGALDNGNGNGNGNGNDNTVPQLVLHAPDYASPSDRQLAEAVAFVRHHASRGTTVYVHCNGGRGRSAVVVIAYLLAAAGGRVDARQAWRYVAARRRIAPLPRLCGLQRQWRTVLRWEARCARQREGEARQAAADEAAGAEELVAVKGGGRRRCCFFGR